MLGGRDNHYTTETIDDELAERGFDPRTSGLWAQHASTAPLCYYTIIRSIKNGMVVLTIRSFVIGKDSKLIIDER